MAGMLEFWRSLFRQSNPSTLTAAGLKPTFILTHPPFRADEDEDEDDDDDGEAKPDGDGDGFGGIGSIDKLKSLSSPNRASRVNGFAALLGGDPQKNGGGDEGTRGADAPEPYPSCKKQ